MYAHGLDGPTQWAQSLKSCMSVGGSHSSTKTHERLNQVKVLCSFLPCCGLPLPHASAEVLAARVPPPTASSKAWPSRARQPR